MKLPIEQYLACFSKTASFSDYLPLALTGYKPSALAEQQSPLISVPEAFIDKVKGTAGAFKDKAMQALDTMRAVQAPQAKDEGPDYSKLLGLAALLGTGYLSMKGIQHLSGLKPSGGFKDKLEKGLLAHSINLQGNQLNNLTQQLAEANQSIKYKNMALAGALGSALLPYAMSSANTARKELSFDNYRKEKENE